MKKYIIPQIKWAELDQDVHLCQGSDEPDETLGYSDITANPNGEVLVKQKSVWEDLW